MENKATTLTIYVQQLTTSFQQLPTPKTVNDIVNSSPVGISAIKKEMGEPVLKAFVTELLITKFNF
jgi:hypothetical protein